MKLNTRFMAFTVVLVLLLNFKMVLVTPASSAQRGAKIDKLRFKVIGSPDAQLGAMQNGELDVLTDMMRTSDIEELDGDGFTVTSAPGFHMGHFAFNIRADQSYRGFHGEMVAPILSDVNFRHATFHVYNQEEILTLIYGYIVTPIHSLVPPGQGAWSNPLVPKHPYNPGDKWADTNENIDGVYVNRYPSNHSASGILRYGGYIYDEGLKNWVTPFDLDGDGTTGTTGVCRQEFDNYIQDLDDVIPSIYLFTPIGPCGTINQHGARFIADANEIGIPLVHMPYEYFPYIVKVFLYADFDMYMVFWGLGRFPDHLFHIVHSSQDSLYNPWRYNSPGINDPILDDLVETIMYSLNHTEKMEAAHEAQRRLYDETNPQALAYIQLYSRVFFSAFSPGLRGIINSPGYGSENSWAHMNIHWQQGHPNERIEDGKSTVIWSLDEVPERLNPTYLLEMFEHDIMGRIFDPLVAMNPYTNDDLPWLAESWELVEDPDGVPGAMNVTFHLRPDIYWQDGMPFTAEDARFNWLFLRDNEIPRYSRMWERIVDVEVINTYTVKAILDVASQWLLYDLSETAALLPPPAWTAWNGRPLNEILGRAPSMEVGPQPDPEEPWYCPTNLYGTGPFIFDHHDSVQKHYDLLRNPNYFKTTDEISAQIVDMFHTAGDVNSNGLLDGEDLSRVTLAFSSRTGDPNYDPEADMNQDEVVDMRDLSQVAYLWGKKREYP